MWSGKVSVAQWDPPGRQSGVSLLRLPKNDACARALAVKSIEEPNTYLESEYLSEWSAKFTVMPACGDDAHRPVVGELRVFGPKARPLGPIHTKHATQEHALPTGHIYFAPTRDCAAGEGGCGT